jgi:DNA-binding NtrC family response regulator
MGAGSRPAQPHAASDGDDLPSRTVVLVVDDDAAIRHLAARVLSDAGYEVLEAAGGREAMAIMFGSARPIGVLLTDIQMPDVDGRRLAAIVRESRADCAVVFMTGDRDVSGRPDMSLPGPPVVFKPFAVAELLGTIETALGERPDAAR